MQLCGSCMCVALRHETANLFAFMANSFQQSLETHVRQGGSLAVVSFACSKQQLWLER
eukprot:m.126973 g.126973  ORF g.126973 m.126973 type:complete len:58 (-) comp13847_c1_seq1:22-195(-)